MRAKQLVLRQCCVRRHITALCRRTAKYFINNNVHACTHAYAHTLLQCQTNTESNSVRIQHFYWPKKLKKKTSLQMFWHVCVCINVFSHILFLHLFMLARRDIISANLYFLEMREIRWRKTSDWWKSPKTAGSTHGTCCFLVHVIFFITSMFCVCDVLMFEYVRAINSGQK